MVENIQNGAEQFASFITEKIPQTNNEKVKYYFSGSLAMLLLSISKKIKPLKSDGNGNIINIASEKEITSDALKYFKNGVRPLSIDIDIVEMHDEDFSNMSSTKFYNLKSIKENCQDWYSLCPNWHGFNGTMYVDILTNEREIFSHNMAILELSNGKKILTVNPVDLMFHKISEICMINKERDYEKFDKDCKDIACLYNGLSALEMLPKNAEKYLQNMTKNNNFSAVNNLLYNDYLDKIKSCYDNSKIYIEPEKQKDFQSMITSVENFNEQSISQLFSK